MVSVPVFPRALRATRHALFLFIFVLLAQTVSRAAGAEQSAGGGVDVLVLTRDQAEAGAAVTIDGRPALVQISAEKLAGGVAQKVTAAGKTLQVEVLPEGGLKQAQTIVLPVSIEDKTLALGVTLNLITPQGNKAEVKIPPRRVFLSIPFTIPVTGAVHPDFGAPGADQFIIQVVPKITKKAQVNLDNTASDGLVANIKYTGAAELRLKDLLNRTNRRDMDGTFYIGRSEDYRWHIITENIFHKFDKRNLGIMRDQRTSKEFLTHWRLDHLENTSEIKFGVDLDYGKKDSLIRLGNIDRRVKDRYHLELNETSRRYNGIVRFEGLEIFNPPGAGPISLRLNRFGWQAGFVNEGKRNTIEGKFGYLKLQDLENQGEIDDYFNFLLRISTPLGKQQGSFVRREFGMAGTLDFDVYGVGSASWVQGELNMNATLWRDYNAIIRLNDDFARITGIPNRPLWESFFISFMRSRNYFVAGDPLAKWGLESVFYDITFSREGKGSNYDRKMRLGASKYITIMRYDIPLELYMEISKDGRISPGAGISIRSYL